MFVQKSFQVEMHSLLVGLAFQRKNQYRYKKKLVKYAGFGTPDAERPTLISRNLQQLQIPIHRNKRCELSYRRKVPNAPTEKFDESIICAGDLRGGKYFVLLMQFTKISIEKLLSFVNR